MPTGLQALAKEGAAVEDGPGSLVKHQTVVQHNLPIRSEPYLLTFFLPAWHVKHAPPPAHTDFQQSRGMQTADIQATMVFDGLGSIPLTHVSRPKQ